MNIFAPQKIRELISAEFKSTNPSQAKRVSHCWCKGWCFAWYLSAQQELGESWINWESWNLWGQKTLQINGEREGFVSSSLPAPIQEFRNLIQGILRGLGGKEFTPTHPGFSLTPHFYFVVIWAFSLEKCLQIFCPEIHPTLTPCSSVPLPPIVSNDKPKTATKPNSKSKTLTIIPTKKHTDKTNQSVNNDVNKKNTQYQKNQHPVKIQTNQHPTKTQQN